MQRLLDPIVVRCLDVFDKRLRTRISMEYMAGEKVKELGKNHDDALPEPVVKKVVHRVW